MPLKPQRRYCGTLVGPSKPMHKCCFASCFCTGRGLRLYLKSLDGCSMKPEDQEMDVIPVETSHSFIQICTGMCGNKTLNLRLENPTRWKIPKAQCVLATCLFFGLMLSNACFFETRPRPMDDETQEVHVPWEPEMMSSPASDSSCFPISIYTDYEIVEIREDGNSLFRSLVYGVAFKEENTVPRPEDLSRLAETLRGMVARQLDLKQSTMEGFIEGDFNKYIERITHDGTFCTEVEVAIASHILTSPIRVYREDVKFDGMILIAEYGKSYTSKPMNLHFRGR